jgi:hypothetical protein
MNSEWVRNFVSGNPSDILVFGLGVAENCDVELLWIFLDATGF